MYETYKSLSRPKRTRQHLWRYLPETRLVDLLRTGELYFTHLPAFSDGLEGALTLRTREHLANWYEHHNKSDRFSAYRQVDEYQSHQQAFYANCWHMNDHESYLMWKAYADRGFAIRTTFERVQAAFDDFDGVVSGGVVHYVDFEREQTPAGNVFNHVITKDLPYKDEREFRLVLWTPDPRNVRLALLENGARVKVNVRMLIERIIRSPFRESDEFELHNLLTERGLQLHSSAVRTR